MSRSQRHLREYQGYDSAGQALQEGTGAIKPGAQTVSFSGTVANQNGNVSVPFSLDLSGYFFGSDTPLAYSVATGTLPSQLTLNASTGVISGTPDTIQTQVGISITCTDNSGNTATTNTFQIDIAA